MRTGGLAALLLLTWLVGANAALTSQVLACDGGVMSFSLHGWLWLLGALAGSWFWLTLRRKLSLDP
jgi:hypothetical protein